MVLQVKTFRTGDAGLLTWRLTRWGGGIRELCCESRGHLADEGWTVRYRLVSWSRNYLYSMAVCLGWSFAVVSMLLFGLTLVCLFLEIEVIIILCDVLVLSVLLLVCFVWSSWSFFFCLPWWGSIWLELTCVWRVSVHVGETFDWGFEFGEWVVFLRSCLFAAF